MHVAAGPPASRASAWLAATASRRTAQLGHQEGRGAAAGGGHPAPCVPRPGDLGLHSGSRQSSPRQPRGATRPAGSPIPCCPLIGGCVQKRWLKGTPSLLTAPQNASVQWSCESQGERNLDDGSPLTAAPRQQRLEFSRSVLTQGPSLRLSDYVLCNKRAMVPHKAADDHSDITPRAEFHRKRRRSSEQRGDRGVPTCELTQRPDALVARTMTEESPGRARVTQGTSQGT